MNHLKKIEDRVISILKTNVDARSDDMMLYLLVCNSFYSNENSVGSDAVAWGVAGHDEAAAVH